MTILFAEKAVKTKRITIRANERGRRDPEDRVIDNDSEVDRREKMMDKTLADSFPASDPLSSLPNPGEDSFKTRGI